MKKTESQDEQVPVVSTSSASSDSQSPQNAVQLSATTVVSQHSAPLAVGRGVPNWDIEQLEVIMEDRRSWQLVVAGPGTGKSAVACQRVAFLVDDGVPPSRILLVSFTRTAVAELRDRIVSYAVAGDRARTVRISTIDSHAWGLRIGFDDQPLKNVSTDDPYELNIERVIELFRAKNPDLLEFMQRLEHLIIDEAQDVVGLRAEFMMEMLRALPPDCGVTILADPAQAIYGFTTDERERESATVSLLSNLETNSPRSLMARRLDRIHRIEKKELVDVFEHTRKIVDQPQARTGHVNQIQSKIREMCSGDIGAPSFEDIASYLADTKKDSMLVLFRRRAEVLIASSYCSNVNIEHRLRMSGTPVIVSPWIGWLLGGAVCPSMDRREFDKLWEQQVHREAAPFEGRNKEDCWTLLHRLAAGRSSGTIDTVQLRQILSRSRPPVEICLADCGTTGPILGTIHAAKGREADNVLLLMPPARDADGVDQSDAVFEEGRVYYVGATRARRMLVVAANTASPVSYLDSGRIYRKLQENKAQLEIGRDGDVDRLAHLCWTEAASIQSALASCAGKTASIEAISMREHDWSIRLILTVNQGGVKRFIEIGEMSQSFRKDYGALWGKIDFQKRLRPDPKIRHIYLIAVTTVGLTDEQRAIARPPFNQSGIALAPVIKGFPIIYFVSSRQRFG